MKIENGYIEIPIYFPNTKEGDGMPFESNAFFDVCKFVQDFFVAYEDISSERTLVCFTDNDFFTIQIPYSEFKKLFFEMQAYVKTQINVRLN
jgi:sulfur relay (sulfurtransferase) DsrC/TusE family protein